MEESKESENSKPSSAKTPKSRGRPQKQSKDAATDLQRARVRRAQKAYRIRKEAHVNAIETKVQDLEKVIEEMTREFVGFSDKLVEGGGVDEGPVGALLRGTLERFLVLGRRAAGDGDGGRLIEREELSGDGSGKEEGSATGSSEELLGDWQVSAEVLPMDEDFALGSIITPDFIPQPTNLSPQFFQTPPQNSNPESISVFNPYVNNIYQPSSSSSSPRSPIPPFIIPYIVAGRDSFASHLYFSTITLAARSLSGSLPFHFAQRMFRYKFPFASRSQLFGVLAGVLNLLLHGTSTVGEGYDSRKTYEDGRVKRKIVGELERRGRREKEYLSSWEVEGYLGGRWGLGVDSRVVRVGGARGMGWMSGFAPTLVLGFEEREQVVLNAEVLVEKLKVAAMTIGEGPRWYIGDIDGVVRSFLLENKAGGLY